MELQSYIYFPDGTAETFIQAVATIFGKESYYYLYSEEAIGKMIEASNKDDYYMMTVHNGDKTIAIPYPGGFYLI
ncbi:hypothetical protein [Cytobacillus horneckiae]|uniref:hypothetical protein n=1 Tax=Cytobacillus horneckiae TaxID=549687 RepID=UPI0019D1CFC3|nr:hypothetical protein [Cytobacillus horneckiae]MBN6890041.1 hypothetical protein [Cytobacillus horneckiae]